jgi:GNAT superfamily N-acetyltransferase
MVNSVSIEIRAGVADDVAVLAPMIERSCALHQGWDRAKFGFIEEAVPMYRRWLMERADDPHSVFVVAAASDAIVAFAIGTTERAAPIYEPANYGLIREFWVEEDWRRHSVGRDVLTSLVERFHAIDIGQIRLETAAANDGARRFFAACGFRPSAIEMLSE